jgi:hypothetical protein
MRIPLLAVSLLALAGPGLPAAASAARASAGVSRPQMVLPFIPDDYTKALAEARARKVPLFIEAWAPW